MLNTDKVVEEPTGTDQETTDEATTEEVTTDETTEDKSEPEGQTDEFKESPEDIEKSRAYHQQKSQDETERRKEIEAEHTALLSQLDGVGNDETTGLRPAAPLKPTKPAVPATEEPEDDGFLTKAQVQSAVTEVMDARDQQRQQDAIDSAWKQEDRVVNATLQAAIKKSGAPKEVVDAAIAYAQEIVPDYNYIGAPKRQCKLALDQIKQWQVMEHKKKRTAEQDETSDKKKADMGLTAQPAGSGATPPQANSAQTLNDKLADDICPDD